MIRKFKLFPLVGQMYLPFALLKMLPTRFSFLSSFPASIYFVRPAPRAHCRHSKRPFAPVFVRILRARTSLAKGFALLFLVFHHDKKYFSS